MRTKLKFKIAQCLFGVLVFFALIGTAHPAHAEWRVVATVAPSDITAHPGDTITVTVTGTIVGDPLPQFIDHYNKLWVLDSGPYWEDNHGLPIGGGQYTETYTIPLYWSTAHPYVVTYTISAYYKYRRVEDDAIDSGPGASGTADVTIHLVGGPGTDPPNLTPPPRPTLEPPTDPTPQPPTTPPPFATTVPPPPPPTETPAPGINIALAMDKQELCAGGWNEAEGDSDQSHKGYKYLVKETGTWAERNQKPDPHIGTLTATVTDENGQPVSGQTVTFTWDMPGPAPEITKTAVTDDDGLASVDVVSGDTLSKVVDEETHVTTYDQAVELDASCADKTAQTSVEVTAAQAKWFYKDVDTSEYKEWDGSVDMLINMLPDLDPTTLRVAMSFEDAPVVGHRVNWGFEKVWYKWGEEVPSSDYAGFGHLSGEYSTSEGHGFAGAIYTFGKRFGKIVFKMVDSSVKVPMTNSEPPTTGGTSNAPSMQPLADPTLPPISPQDKKYLDKGDGITVNTYVDNDRMYADASYQGLSLNNGKNFSPAEGASTLTHFYPAPKYEEDDEPLTETLTAIKTALARSPLYMREGRDYWISQGIGRDPLSAGYHHQDGFVTFKTNAGGHSGEIASKTKYPYCAAVDIVLTKIGTQKFDPKPWRVTYLDMSTGSLKTERENAFRPIVQVLRGVGFAAWHRWVNLAPGYVENEIHLIDPIFPLKDNRGRNYCIKSALRDQLDDYVDGGGGMATSAANQKDHDFLPFDGSDAPDSDKSAFYGRKRKSVTMLRKYIFQGVG